ncbi:cellulase family glycosylhydrolase [Ruficoccus sp. ZRK36]|uniref:cellulase family glycosylhydrolase n=1 Tax=Ruficoccus sp. ZRK36 TaxID=2866311 RepID=UPI001C7341F2|nr:cellulase family glycosylhydrolase [Ruficoccus sp. ZRK36]QYY35449.1 cellulase family glycosylhydrolase [Ruficoccus sp. ZRK36]
MQDTSGLTPSSTPVRYFEENGKTFIPIGLNLCFPRFISNEQEGLDLYAQWIKRLADAGGNYMRLWLGHAFFDLEPEQAGVFCPRVASRLDRVLKMAHERGIRVKLTLDHFRSISTQAQAEIFPGAASFDKPVYAKANGGCAEDMDAFLTHPDGQALYLKKLDWLSERYAEHPAIFGWELWNEMNSVNSSHWPQWTRLMLPELRKRFPRHRVMQSLGSFDRESQNALYADYATMRPMDLVQVHRYLDPAAGFTQCQGPADLMCADAVNTLREMAPDLPVILAETGAVEANHSAPAKLYASDTEGLLLHDLIFAPFFSGSAGCGQMWHWDYYVTKHNLWWHYGRFARAIEGFNPAGDGPVHTSVWETDDLRAYGLSGRCQSLIWLRDTSSDWRSEIIDGQPAPLRQPSTFALPDSLPRTQTITCYDPWEDRETVAERTAEGVQLPAFRRSLVLRLK